MDFLDPTFQGDHRIYIVGLYETYLFRPHMYMPLVRYINHRIADLTMENL